MAAHRVFARLGADPEAYRHALATRHDAALAAMGLGGASPSWADADADAGAAAPAPESLPRGLFDAQPSGQALMQSLPALQRRLLAPLCGAHIVLAAARMAHSAAGRAFNTIGIDLQALSGAAEAELRAAALARPAD